MTAEKRESAADAKDRKARLAAELRANLLKRKAQARQRKAATKSTEDGAKKD